MKKKTKLSKQNNFFRILIMFLCINSMYSQDCNKYKITNIDSTQNNYLIYLKAYKPLLLVSPKSTIMTNGASKKILIGKKYKFCIYENNITKGIPKNLSPTISIDEKIIWKTDDKHKVVFTKQLAGLYYLGLKE